jgi:hypothetical protein
MKKIIILLLSISLLLGCAGKYELKNPHMIKYVGDSFDKKYLKPFDLNKPYEYPIQKAGNSKVRVGLLTYKFAKVGNQLEISCTLKSSQHLTRIRSGVWFTDDGGVVIARRQLINSPELRDGAEKTYIELIPYDDFKYMTAFLKCSFWN